MLRFFLKPREMRLTGVDTAAALAESIPRAESHYRSLSQKNIIWSSAIFRRDYENFPLTVCPLSFIVKRRTKRWRRTALRLPVSQSPAPLFPGPPTLIGRFSEDAFLAPFFL